VKKTFKLRPRPKEPVRHHFSAVRHHFSGRVIANDGGSLYDILGSLPENVDLHNTTIEVEKDYGYHDNWDVSVHVWYPKVETDEDLQVRMEAYQEKLKAWESWFDENQEQIKLRALEDRQKDFKTKQRREEALRKKLEREIASAEKTIKRNAKLLAPKTENK
jgi:hypothetical protein